MQKSEAELAELLGRMRGLAVDHEPQGWPAIQMKDITALCDAIVALNTRNRALESHAAALADALNGYQESCGEDHDRGNFDCPTCGKEERILNAYYEFIQPKG
jgi:hypothetical protein